MRPVGSPRQLEKRRRRAIELLGEGVGPYYVAKRLGVTPKSVYRWRDAYNAKGANALAPKSRVGLRRKLTPAQEKDLLRVLLHGPLAAGYRTDLWTTRRVAEVILRRFRVRYSAAHMSRLLARLGWSCQKPLRRSKERNQRMIDGWLATEWPKEKKR